MIPREPIRFDSFMQRALHDPERGYYARTIRGIGRGGDFTTAPKVSGLLARALAGWIQNASRETGCRELIEIGPGDGALAEAILRELPWRKRITMRYHLVESSPPLASRQRERLGRQVRHHRSIEDALAACHGRALIFSNELVDAFAVRRFEKTESGWREIFVHRDEIGRIHETLMQGSPLPDSCAFKESFPKGQRVEVHDSYRTWLAVWLPKWRHGRMLTIDYGGEIESLYHRRHHGTVRAYLLQQRLEGHEIYQNPGLQDLTADVNFTDLQQWHRNSMESLELSKFGAFLQRFAEVRNLSDQSLLDPDGAASAFLVLEQRPRIPAADLPNEGGPV